MASTMLWLEFRRSAHVSLASAIREYISDKYDQHPDMFRNDLQVIDALRRDAVNSQDPHPSAIKKLQAYAAQLVWVSGKFPIDIGVDFTWYPSLGYNTGRPIAHNNLQYELMNVLFNLAALYSQLAVAADRSTAEGVKSAASYFSHGAGVLKHMRTVVLPELRMQHPPDDMDEATLESLTQLFLAQAQECFWQKAVSDGYKDASIAQLAACVSDLYNLAGEAAMRSDAISSAWIHHVSAKHHHFAAAAQFRAAADCLEKRKYGEEVARLTDALACVKEGLKECKGNYLNKTVVDDLIKLKGRLEQDLKRAERDNDKIYLQIVPPKPELAILKRAKMAVEHVPPQVAKPHDYLGDTAEFGPPLFAKLVPFSVHVAISIYEERRDRLVNSNIVAELEAMTDALHSILSSLNLPGSLQALEKPLGLPATLVQHAEEIRQVDALNRLERGLRDIEKLCASDKMIFEEGKALLAAEEEEDRKLRLKYGTQRWTRPESRADPRHDGGAKLWNQVAEIEGYLASSTSSDAVVRDKFAGVKDTLAILAGPDRGIMDYIPNSRKTEIPEPLKPAIGRLRGVYNDVLRLESRRRKRVESLRARARADDIKEEILAETARLERAYPKTPIVPAHFEDFFTRRLDRLYEAELELVEKEKADQEKVVEDLQRANREFEAQKKSLGKQGSHEKERERALQKLDAAYYKYKDIVNNLEGARKFYNDLSRIVEGFRIQCRNWVNARRKEAQELEEELSLPSLASLSLNPTNPPPQPAPSSYQTAPRPTQPRYAQPPLQQQPQQQAQLPVQTPIQQPRPIPVAQSVGNIQTAWSPEMGIRFAGGAGAGSGVESGRQGGEPPPPQGRGTWEPGLNPPVTPAIPWHLYGFEDTARTGQKYSPAQTTPKAPPSTLPSPLTKRSRRKKAKADEQEPEAKQETKFTPPPTPPFYPAHVDPYAFVLRPNSKPDASSAGNNGSLPARDPPLGAILQKGTVLCLSCFNAALASWTRVRDGVLRALTLLGGDEAVMRLCELKQVVEEAEREVRKIVIASDDGTSKEELHFTDYPADIIGLVLLRVLCEEERTRAAWFAELETVFGQLCQELGVPPTVFDELGRVCEDGLEECRASETPHPRFSIGSQEDAASVFQTDGVREECPSQATDQGNHFSRGEK
ncbi:hypothetical protein VTJ49DRAFT_5150 [Mycothermus thermophilus]|uniref:BRO1 domain-containing protein n=1 Tax=Humicola insolens TaxID=85995 RepID=A0ABR3V4R4_HUMIN